jgi:hypothetical protein
MIIQQDETRKAHHERHHLYMSLHTILAYKQNQKQVVWTESRLVVSSYSLKAHKSLQQWTR